MASAQGSWVPLQHAPDTTQSPRIPERPTNSVRVVKKRARRTKIPKAAKSILEQFFSSNPYPDKDELRTLRSSTKLTESAIRTWFSNSRSRKAGRCSSCHGTQMSELTISSATCHTSSRTYKSLVSSELRRIG